MEASFFEKYAFVRLPCPFPASHAFFLPQPFLYPPYFETVLALALSYPVKLTGAGAVHAILNRSYPLSK